MFKYIDENLNKIINPDNVNMIRTFAGKLGEGNVLRAFMNGGENINLTKPKNKLEYPFEPIYYLSQEMGRFYWKDFGIIDNQLAVNRNHLTKVTYSDDKSANRFKIQVYFDDGNNYLLARPLKKYFLKQFKQELEKKLGMEIIEESSNLSID